MTNDLIARLEALALLWKPSPLTNVLLDAIAALIAQKETAPARLDLVRRSIRTGCETADNRTADFELKRLGYRYDASDARWVKGETAPAPVDEPPSPWKEAVIDAAVVNWTLTTENANDPRKAIADLVHSITLEALDPAISKTAHDLVERAERAEAALAAASPVPAAVIPPCILPKGHEGPCEYAAAEFHDAQAVYALEDKYRDYERWASAGDRLERAWREVRSLSQPMSDLAAAVRAFLCADTPEPPCPNEWDEYKDGYIQGYGDAVERLQALLPTAEGEFEPRCTCTHRRSEHYGKCQRPGCPSQCQGFVEAVGR